MGRVTETMRQLPSTILVCDEPEEGSEVTRLLRERDILVEVCLSSNVDVLSVSGPAHPLAAIHHREQDTRDLAAVQGPDRG